MLERKRDRIMHMGCEDSMGRTSVSRKSEREKEREREREREHSRTVYMEVMHGVVPIGRGIALASR